MILIDIDLDSWNIESWYLVEPWGIIQTAVSQNLVVIE